MRRLPNQQYLSPAAVEYMNASMRFVEKAKRLDEAGDLAKALENAERAYEIVKNAGGQEIQSIQRMIDSAEAIVNNIKMRMNQ